MKPKAGTMPGPGHVSRGIENQDAYAVAFFEDFTIGAVADGAGSKANAQLGAKYSAEWAVDYVVNSLSLGDEPSEALENAVISVAQELKQLEDYESYGATLALAIKGKDKVFVKTVGDAFAVVSNHGNLALVRAESLDPSPNITTFLTSDRWESASYQGEGDCVFLCSDGLDFGSLQNGDLFLGFWGPLAAEIKSVNFDELLEAMDAAGKIQDDATILAF